MGQSAYIGRTWLFIDPGPNTRGRGDEEEEEEEEEGEKEMKKMNLVSGE